MQRFFNNDQFSGKGESSVIYKRSHGTPQTDTMTDVESGDTSESISTCIHQRKKIQIVPVNNDSFSSEWPSLRFAFISCIPLFDMRCKIASFLSPCKNIEISTPQKCEEVREHVANSFNVPKEQVAYNNIKDMEGITTFRSNFRPRSFDFVSIINPSDLETHIPLLVMSEMDHEQVLWDHYHESLEKNLNRNICCVLLPKGERVHKLKQGVSEKYKLQMNSFALALNKTRVKETDKIEDAAKPYDLLHIVKQKSINIHFELLKCAKLKHVINFARVSSISTVGFLKKILIKTFSDLGPTMLTEKNICLSKEDKLLHEELLLSSVQDFPQRLHNVCSELTLKVHLVQPRFTWYKIDTVTLMGMKTIEIICMNEKSSTAMLRAEIAKICMCPSEALKLVASGKKIPEKENIQEISFLLEGCTIKASICSKIRVNVTVVGAVQQCDKRLQQLQVEVYKLDTVLKLKEKVIQNLPSPVESYTCDVKKECTLEECRFLRCYGIVNETEITAIIFKNRIQVSVVILRTKQNVKVFIDEPQITTVKNFLIYIHKSGLVDVHHKQLRLLYRHNCLPMELSISDADVHHGSQLVISTVEKINPQRIIKCGMTGEAECMHGIVMHGRIYLASWPIGADDFESDTSNLESHDDAVVTSLGIRLEKSSCINFEEPSLLLPSHFNITDVISSEGMERKGRNSPSRKKSEGAECDVDHQGQRSCVLPQLEQGKFSVQNSSKTSRMINESQSEGYLSEPSDLEISLGCKQTHLKKAKASPSKLESNTDDALSPHDGLVSKFDKRQTDLESQTCVVSSGQQNHIHVTSESTSTCMTASISSMQSSTGTKVTAVTSTTCLTSCGTISQSRVGAVAYPLNFANTHINMQSPEGHIYRGGISEKVEFFQKDNETWRHRTREELVQVTSTSAGLDTLSLNNDLNNNHVTDLDLTPNGHYGTMMNPRRSLDLSGQMHVKHHELTQDLLLGIAECVGSRWKKLGRKLGVKDEKLDEIDTSTRFLDCVEKCYQMLLLWRTGSEHATKEVLAAKLINIDLRSVADKYLLSNYETV